MSKTSSHYVLVLLELAQNLGITIAELQQQLDFKLPKISSDMSAQKETWLDNDGLTKLIKTIWRHSKSETMGLDPDPCQMGTWALACDHMIVAETLSELYRRGEHIYHFVPPASVGIHFSVDDNNATINVLSYIGEQDPHRFLTEFLTIVWHRFACWAIDEYIPLSQAFFSYPCPAHGHFYQELFQCPIAFDQPACGYSFSKKYLSKPVCRSKAELAAWLHHSPADLLYIPGRDNSITHHIRKQLTQALHQHMRYPAFDSICNDLHMSSQVVRRRLEEEGTSYQKIKDAVRQELIKERLLNPDIPISDIAESSGFTEAASLARAFKKWTGITPAQYRQKKIKKH